LTITQPSTLNPFAENPQDSRFIWFGTVLMGYQGGSLILDMISEASLKKNPLYTFFLPLSFNMKI